MTDAIPAETSATEHRSSAWRWWKNLNEEDRAGRAELRRCGSVAEVAFTAPYHQLLRRLGSRLKEGDAMRVAALAAILSHVEDEPASGASVARQMGTAKSEGQNSIVSDSRFRHLLRADDADDLMREMIRIVRQLDRKVPVDAMFRDLMRWDEKTRMQWARDFYEAAPITKKA